MVKGYEPYILKFGFETMETIANCWQFPYIFGNGIDKEMVVYYGVN